MAVYISRKYKIAYGSSKNVELLFKGLIKARIKHDFIFYSHMKKLEKFEEVWSVEMFCVGLKILVIMCIL